MTKILSSVKEDGMIFWQASKIGYYDFCSIICNLFGAKDISKCLDEIAMREFKKSLEYWKKDH